MSLHALFILPAIVANIVRKERMCLGCTKPPLEPKKGRGRKRVQIEGIKRKTTTDDDDDDDLLAML